MRMATWYSKVRMHSYFASRVNCCHIMVSADKSVLSNSTGAIDVRLSKTRDMAGTKAFFAQAIGLHEDAPDKVATDGLASYPRAIEEELGKESNTRFSLAQPIL